MSLESSAWAFRQKVPPKPKIVLLALADQADERTGRICYGKTDMKHLAAKSSVGERSIYRYIGALVRNGYVKRQSGKEKGQSSEYWLLMDRETAKSMSEWQWKASDEEIEADADETQDVDGGYAKMADPIDGENESADDQIGRGGLPMVADQESAEDDLTSTSRAREQRESSFSRKAQDVEIESGVIKAAAAKANAKTFVYENSDAWKAWATYRRAHGLPGTLPTCTQFVNGKPKRGWWLPSLYPPRDKVTGSTDPPQSSTG